MIGPMPFRNTLGAKYQLQHFVVYLFQQHKYLLKASKMHHLKISHDYAVEYEVSLSERETTRERRLYRIHAHLDVHRLHPHSTTAVRKEQGKGSGSIPGKNGQQL